MSEACSLLANVSADFDELAGDATDESVGCIDTALASAAERAMNFLLERLWRACWVVMRKTS